MSKAKGIILFLIDMVLVVIAYYLGLYVRFEWSLPGSMQNALHKYLLYVLAIKAIIFLLFGLYRILWKYASVEEYIRVVFAVFVANFLSSAFLLFVRAGLPRSIFAIVLILELLFIGGIRIVFRLNSVKGFRIKKGTAKRVLILGAGEAGVMVLREFMKSENLNSKVVAFIDDDPKKAGKTIHGVTVLGNRNRIKEIVDKYSVDEIIFAMPSATTEDRRDYIERATATSATVKTVPGVYEIINDEVQLSHIREVSIEDLLGREQVKLNQEELKTFLRDRVVLVTGGGGSIGSELARQICRYNPKKLILLDMYENNVYEVQLELQRDYPNQKLTVLIDSVRNHARMEYIMSTYKPEIVFHAAAHKHVPLMEDSPQSAVLNNVFGTYNLVSLSHKYGVKKFVMISTDKAVNPTNIMGTTKRIGEMIVQAYNPISETDFVAVRFGNVLGSNGSVIPLFKKQIKEGGPLTVTHEDINRYFMTIPEACQLVLQAGSLAKGGEVFILDMGEPVKIMDLARELIRLSGLVEGRDIEIKVTGLRPGEKLYEELLLDREHAQKTEHEKIFIESLPVMEVDELEQKLKELWEVVSGNNRQELVEFLKKLVPTYHPNENKDEG